MFGSIKIAMVVIMLASAGGGFMYVKTLKSDLAVSEANNAKLLDSVSEQQAVIAQQKKDFTAILEANQELQDQNRVLKTEFAALDKRFNKINGQGEVRDIGKLAEERPTSVERVVNSATKKSEINSECPSLANPNYVPY